MDERHTVLGWLDQRQRSSQSADPRLIRVTESRGEDDEPITKARGDDVVGLASPETRTRGDDDVQASQPRGDEPETFVRGEEPETTARGDE